MAGKRRQISGPKLDNGHCHCPAELIDAIEEAVRESEVPIREVAHQLGVSPDLVRAWICEPDNVSAHHRCPHLSRLVPLSQATESLALVRYVCRSLGLETPRPSEPCEQSPTATLSDAMIAMGGLLTEALKAIADGELTTDELLALQPLLPHLREKLDALDAAAHERRRNGHA